MREALDVGRFTLVTSEPLLTELADVLVRPRIARRYGITDGDIAELIISLRHLSIYVPVLGDLQLCRDPDDDVVIETAIRGRADVLVTRDDDLKDAPEVADVLATVGIAVVTVRRFLRLLDEVIAPPDTILDPDS